MACSVLWFRRDLRLDDLPALRAAIEVGARRRHRPLRGRPGPPRAGQGQSATLPGGWLWPPWMPNSRAPWWYVGGDPITVVPEVAAEVGASVVTATADFGPHGTARDAAVAPALRPSGRRLTTVDSNYAVAPGRIRTGGGHAVQGLHRVPAGVGGDRVAGPVPPPRTCDIADLAERRRAASYLESGLATPGPTACPTGGRASPRSRRGAPRRRPARGMGPARALRGRAVGRLRP